MNIREQMEYEMAHGSIPSEHGQKLRHGIDINPVVCAWSTASTNDDGTMGLSDYCKRMMCNGICNEGCKFSIPKIEEAT